MDNVISMVTRLQNAAAVLGDGIGSKNRSFPSLWERLPSIVVIGGQSSGKSSVLEAVVGRDFLPRGTGIVTRRPLVLQLVHLDDSAAQEVGEFMHAKGRKYTNFDQIRQEIEDETIRHLGNLTQKAVSPDPIFLTVSSPNVPNLTLVDMPGLTKVPIDGQPRSIVKEIDDMVRAYIKGENAIILAVSPANADLATSDALRMARDVDPNGERTIGVLTKIDIMDPGTSVRDVLQSKHLRLKHGWVGVVNRGQKDINSKMDMHAARSRESEFFSGNSEYSDLENVGTGYLSQKLSTHLLNEIKRALPGLLTSIKSEILALEKELAALGASMMDSRGQMVHFILKRCREFETTYSELIDRGKGGGERILEVFEQKLHGELHQLPFDQVLNVENVRRIISQADGIRPHLIAPEMGYRRLLETGLKLMKDPAQSAVEEIHRILLDIIDLTLQNDSCKMLTKYGILVSEINNAVVTRLESLKNGSREMVKTLVEMEASYFSANIFRHIIELQTKAGSSTMARAELKDFKTLSGKDIDARIDDESSGQSYLKKIASQVSAYLNFVRRQLLNTVPKAIIHAQVMKAKDNILDALQEQVASKDEEELARLLHEDPDVTRRRAQCQQRLKLLTRAASEISGTRF
eukprot:g5512.t1